VRRRLANQGAEGKEEIRGDLGSCCCGGSRRFASGVVLTEQLTHQNEQARVGWCGILPHILGGSDAAGGFNFTVFS
jgi:hypothetical protein